MCKIVEEYAEEVVNERDLFKIRNLFMNGGSLGLAIATYENIPENTIRKIYEEVEGAKTLT